MEKGKSEECRKCAHLQVLSVYMDGKVKYGCGKVPVYVKPCKAFEEDRGHVVGTFADCVVPDLQSKSQIKF